MQFNSRRSPVLARNGIVSTSQPLAAMAGLRILMNGGNAVDAAVAAAAALNVVEPMSTGIGGDLFALLWSAKDKKVTALNASGRAPAAANIDELRKKGWTSIPATSPYGVTVPGAVDGWHTLVTQKGSMPLADVLAPAIEYAEKGYPVSPIIAQGWADGFPKLAAHASGSELMYKGQPPRTGQVMKLPELAKSLRLIAEGGRDAFYKGPIAQKISSYIQEKGGWLTPKDFADNRPDWDQPITADYRGVTVWECPPNGQGLNALMALNIAEGFDIASMGHQSAATYHHLIESMRVAYSNGLRYIADPRKTKVPLKTLLSREYATTRRAFISPHKAIDRIAYDPNIRDSDTIYCTAVDGHGNACSLINSLYQGFGTGLVAPTTGIALQNRGISFALDASHPNSLAPGKRPFHTIIPGMATRGGDLWLSFGVMGGFQQAQGHLQVIVNMVDFGLDPQSALDSRRFNVNNDGSTSLEQDVSSDVIDALRRMGHRITDYSGADDVFYGGGQIIARDPNTGVLTAGSDPRKDGCALGW
ncbi:MAG: gamma-glutamyltransferase [SAR202 cluster bacterium]|nr:gamma-glutamyltransferase [SAR202 cluster bacterium]